MPAADPSNTRAASLEPRPNDYDDAVDDFLRDIAINNDNTPNNQPEPVKDIDEEIKVRKKRTPIPKFDETLLLSDKGITKLRKVVKTRLRFKGRGHEFNDVAKLLNTYQLWLDDLYPRAKFRDALTIVEKLGHGKRMQMTRKGWIDESKPNRKEDTPERQTERDEAMAVTGERRYDGDHNQSEQSGSKRPRVEDDQDMPDEDDLDALLNNTASRPAEFLTTKQRGPFAADSDDEDDLAALMADNDTSRATGATQMKRRPGPFEVDNDDDDEDELDALLAENEVSGPSTTVETTTQNGQQVQEEEPDDWDALLAEHENNQVAEGGPSRKTEREHAEDNLEDEEYLDALMVEQEPLQPSEMKPGPDPAKQQRHHLDDVVNEDHNMVEMNDT